MNKAQVEIRSAGSIVQFVPLTKRAMAWFEENVASEPWQWLNGALCVDRRMSDGLIVGLEAAGLLA